MGRRTLRKQAIGIPFVNEGTYVISSKKTSSDSSLWYEQIISTVTYNYAKIKYFALAKVSSDGKTLEIAIADSNYPKNIDPNSPGYRIY